MTLRGSGKSFLRTMSKRMRGWVQAVCEGKDPFDAVREFYPQAEHVATRVEELFAHPKVKEALRIITQQNMRMRLLKVVADPKSATNEVLAATKQLERMDRPEEPEKKKKGFGERPPLEDKALEARMKDLGQKAKVN